MEILRECLQHQLVVTTSTITELRFCGNDLSTNSCSFL